MGRVRTSTVAPDPAWAIPATDWTEVLDRYTTLLQVPTWRASVKRGGEEKAPCLAADEAELLRNQMGTALARVSDGRLLAAKPSSRDLEKLWARGGRSIPRPMRCPSKLQVHFQRAFLLDAAGYRCTYCLRTAWGVFAEKSEGELPRTLRFEVDHHTTRGRLTDRDRFDPENLIAACRSCNVIKAEMPMNRFLAELASLSGAVQQGRGTNTTKTV